jgi:hypothetical protein
MTRAGRRFTGIFSTTGQAPVQAVPTTTATWALYNGDPNRSYVLDNLSAFFLSGTAGIGAGFMCIVTKPTATLPTAATGSAIGSRSNGGLNSKAILATAYTIPTPTGFSQWGFMEMASTLSVAPAAAGTFVGSAADAQGRVIVPPGQLLGVALLAPAGTTPLYIVGANWHEVELDLE